MTTNGNRGAVLLDGVCKTYQRGQHDVEALAGASIAIDPGEFVVLLGPSGSGKTTLLNLIGGIESATSGTILVDNTDLAQLSERELTAYRRTTIGFVFQFFNLVPTLTAVENVEVIAELTGPNAAARARAALDQVGLTGRANHFPAQLSGGEQQRVAVARALVKDAHVLLADEPTGSLDLETGKQVLAILRESTDRGETVILVTHNSAIAAIADRVIHLRDGHIADDRRNPSPLAVDEVNW